MNGKITRHLMLALVVAAGCVWLIASSTARLTEPSRAVLAAVPSPPTLLHTSTPLTLLADSPISPTSPVKLIFIHHSCGENWLADADGGLGIALRDNNYFVSDTNYGWGPLDADLGYGSIGDHTDIGHWYNWFVGPNHITYTTALYTEYGQHSSYSRFSTDPGGENKIIMFKSCYPNSYLDGPTGPPTGDPNPLRGQDAGSGYHTVANAKGIYNDLLTYFATRQDKLFVVITAPPQEQSETDATHAANARTLNDWLVDEWLVGYAYTNVAVFDFYNVLTSNGGDTRTDDPNKDDLGWTTGNHHRWLTDTVQHTQTVSNDYSAYWGGSGGGSHPTAAGNRKATGEFALLLNVFYNRWKSGAVPASLSLIAPNGGESWAIGAEQEIRWTSTGTVTHVGLSYSTDGFATKHVIISPTANTGSYDWTVPDDPSTSVRVRVASVTSPTTVYDDSNADFTIYDATGQQTMIFQDGVSPNAGYYGTADVTLASDVPSNANTGGVEYLETYYGDVEYRRSLVRWNLSALPGGATISAATLELYRHGAAQASPTQLALYRITSDWAEGTGSDFWPDASYVPDGATWLTATAGTAWTTPGGDYDATVLDQFTIPAVMGTGWVRLDATGAVQAWVEGGASNYGLLLRPQSGEWTVHDYHSRECFTPTLRPRLVVTYSVGAAPGPSLTLIAPVGGEHWPVSSTRQIRWNTNPPASIPEVNLYYSTDGFVTTRTITSSLVNTGVYTWTTPPTPTKSAQVWVVSVVSPSIRDTSGAFTLYDPSTFTNTAYLPLSLRQYGVSSPGGSLIQPLDLEYQGAFRLPDVPGLYTATWAYGGSAMTYYPGGDPDGEADGYPGSIFGAGHAQTQYISEISIPPPIISAGKHVTDLNTAETLQGFHDIKGLVFKQTYWEIPRVGLAYLPKQDNQTADKLHFCWATHAPGEDSDTGPTHGWCELDLASPQPAGAWRIDGYKKYVTADYLFEIPRAWADMYTPGRYLATGRYRDGGQGAEGPSLLAYAAPWNESSPPVSGTLLSATPLLLYGDVYESNPVSMTNYHHSDEWSGGAWLTAGDKSAVIFVGTKGQGDCWYGCADGTIWPEEPPFPPDCPERGWWSTGFEGQIIFYDPADLGAVAQGVAEAFDPQPYVTVNIDAYLYHIESSQQKDHVGAASFDRERGLLYVFEPFADGDKPLVHVWKAR